MSKNLPERTARVYVESRDDAFLICSLLSGEADCIYSDVKKKRKGKYPVEFVLDDMSLRGVIEKIYSLGDSISGYGIFGPKTSARIRLDFERNATREDREAILKDKKLTYLKIVERDRRGDCSILELGYDDVRPSHILDVLGGIGNIREWDVAEYETVKYPAGDITENMGQDRRDASQKDKKIVLKRNYELSGRRFKKSYISFMIGDEERTMPLKDVDHNDLAMAIDLIRDDYFRGAEGIKFHDLDSGGDEHVIEIGGAETSGISKLANNLPKKSAAKKAGSRKRRNRKARK